MAQFESRRDVAFRKALSARGHDLPGRRTGSDRTEWRTLEIETPGAERGLPLVVDLDGTLIASDLLIETAFSELGKRPQALLDMAAALAQGKAALKHRLASPAILNPGTLPYDPAVLEAIRQARAEGRPSISRRPAIAIWWKASPII